MRRSMSLRRLRSAQPDTKYTGRDSMRISIFQRYCGVFWAQEVGWRHAWVQPAEKAARSQRRQRRGRTAGRVGDRVTRPTIRRTPRLFRPLFRGIQQYSLTPNLPAPGASPEELQPARPVRLPHRRERSVRLRRLQDVPCRGAKWLPDGPSTHPSRHSDLSRPIKSDCLLSRTSGVHSD